MSILALVKGLKMLLKPDIRHKSLKLHFLLVYIEYTN